MTKTQSANDETPDEAVTTPTAATEPVDVDVAKEEAGVDAAIRNADSADAPDNTVTVDPDAASAPNVAHPE